MPLVLGVQLDRLDHQVKCVDAVHFACHAVGTAVAAIKSVADRLGNPPATCRKYYVHPVVLELYVGGELTEHMTAIPRGRNLEGLGPSERCVLQILMASRADIKIIAGNLSAHAGASTSAGYV